MWWSAYIQINIQQDFKTNLKVFVAFITFGGLVSAILFICYHVFNRNEKNLEKLKEKIGNLYFEVKLREDRKFRSAFPLFLLERLIFVIPPFLFPDMPGYQIMFLISYKFALICIYLHLKPFAISRTVNRLKLLVDWLNYSIYVWHFCFTGLIADENLKF
jgi:hypothetical protein